MDSDSIDSADFSKLLLGPGPSNVPQRILKAISNNCISHLDPDFFDILDEISKNLKNLFKTKNETTFAISGTGSAGMEAAFANIIEKDDKALIFNSGLFGDRMADVASRYGGRVIEVKKEWGKNFKFQEMKEAIDREKDLKVVAIVHAETSTGSFQPIEELGEYLKNSDIIFIVDSVTSFTGINLEVDNWSIDICYSGTQKCLNVPPGLSPITFSEKALNKIKKRKEKVQSWYLDINLLKDYHEQSRVYHHTAPVNMLYGFNEGLKICLEEGLEERFSRHQKVSKYFDSIIKSTDFGFFVDKESDSLPMLKSLVLPKSISDDLRLEILKNDRIEIGGGLGHTKGLIWRVGFMGCNAEIKNVDIFFEVLKSYV
ncbi:alanine--glyoxylate aminotransferase family protein [bacterium]|nr:alanine--glyoxylate aminotransferase family protein [bacterium]|tara:strand:+ start:835 stop:1950 length:1116 start_codon:yes stop_codon:yes gene_type:complete